MGLMGRVLVDCVRSSNGAGISIAIVVVISEGGPRSRYERCGLRVITCFGMVPSGS